MLEQDHHEIEMLFDQYDRAADDEKPLLIDRICYEIEAHACVELGMFYPAVRSALGPDGAELVAEALVEHHRVARDIESIRATRRDDSVIEQKFALLMENVRYHVDEQETEMFPLVRANMASQLGALGEALDQQRHLLEMAGG